MIKFLILCLFVFSAIANDEPCSRFTIAQDKQYLECLNKFTATGDIAAIKKMANYYYGGPNKDYNKAIEWYLKIEDKDPEIQATLGAIYTFGGYGLQKNEEKAFEWYKKSMQNGSMTGTYNVGSSYLYGRGVPQNCDKAVHIIQYTADKNAWFGQYMLGLMYFEGRCVNKDINQAKLWLRKSYKNGNKYQALYFWNQQKWGSIED